ncbi:MAG: tetratricopeptide repeat protein [Desulfobacterales bacterium]|nr:tetratricopeptide repeat protein [Desulfobacterales bacterium]
MLNKKWLILFLIGLFFSSISWGSTDDIDVLFHKANNFYSDGEFEEALSIYTEISEKHGYSASLLYNMANAYYQMGQIGFAVLNFERALLLEPNNPDIKANLHLVRKDSGLFLEDVSFWRRFFNSFSLNAWTVLMSLCFGLCSFLFFVKGLLLNFVKDLPQIVINFPYKKVALTLVVLFVLCGIGVGVKFKDYEKAVIISKEVYLLVSPFETAKKAGIIREGKIVTIGKSYGNFVSVKEPGGQSGWVEKSNVETIYKF